MRAEKIFRASRGRCTCDTVEYMKECLYYQPLGGSWQPEMCAWIDEWSGFICLREESINERRTE